MAITTTALESFSKLIDTGFPQNSDSIHYLTSIPEVNTSKIWEYVASRSECLNE